MADHYQQDRVMLTGGQGLKPHVKVAKASKLRRSHSMMRLLLQFTFAFLVTSVLLMGYVTHVQEDENFLREVDQEKEQLKEQIREQKLRVMQATMFRNYRRPPDSTYNINVTLSDITPLDREIDDTRPMACREIKYDVSTLPTISVVTVFYNEPLSMILRTVHSVLSRTPPQLLKDVVIVNDHSTNEDLDDKLDNYVKLLPDKVRVLRTKKREGLIRARMVGFSVCRGDVVMFQDAHTEANVGWAEPMLLEILKDPKTIVQPEVEVIDAWSLQYFESKGTVPRGGWTWDLRYVWMQLPPHERQRVADEAAARGVEASTVPFRAAALVGCAFAVRRDHFLAIGAFDEGMNVWGGENIELALRNWMCHGRVITHPCTRVAHTFKPFAYKFDGDRDKIVQKNLMRLAEVWMDDWKKFFLASTYNWPTKRTSFTKEELESLEERRQLRRDLKCKSFEWYMKTVTPDVPTPPMEASYYGEITNLKTERCWKRTSDDYVTLHTFCFFHRFLPEHLYWIDQHGRLHHGDQCAYVAPQYDLIRLGTCDFREGQDKWYMQATREVEGKLKVDITRNGNKYTLCATQVTNIVGEHKNEQMAQALACDDNQRFQHWRFHYKFDWTYDFGPMTLES